MAGSLQSVAGENVKHAGAEEDGTEQDVGDVEHGLCPFDAGTAPFGRASSSVGPIRPRVGRSS
jgi:hypothetical protein